MNCHVTNIDEHKELFIKPELRELNNNEITPTMKKRASVAKKLKKSELIDI